MASSEAYPHQAFRVGPSAYGLQFHVEVSAALAGHWTPHLPSGIFVRMSDVSRHRAAAAAPLRHRAFPVALAALEPDGVAPV